MALFEERKIESVSLGQLNIKELAKGESVMFYVGGFADRTSADYGDFKVVEGLLLDDKSPNVKALIESGTGSSFIPNTMLLNMIEEKKLREGLLYRIEKAWDRDEKFSNGKKAKGFGFNVFELGCDKDSLGKLMAKFLEAKSSNNSDAPKPKGEM